MTDNYGKSLEIGQRVKYYGPGGTCYDAQVVGFTPKRVRFQITNSKGIPHPGYSPKLAKPCCIVLQKDSCQ